MAYNTAAPAGQVTIGEYEVLADWIDYNGHLTEARYLDIASQSAVAFLKTIGADLDYVATGRSYYSVENHVRYYAEAKLGQNLTVTIQVLDADPKRLRIYIRLIRDGEVIASVDQLNLHVDMKAAMASAAAPEVLAKLMPIAKAHKTLPRPEDAGRGVGERK
jgi:carnitine 3-dehydrogenase